uniref:Phytocyanin domain-containing protein n=1 Tax=Davidia involucrata TaxID=16924 RepID=A0A5B7B873_DAVIN
MALAAESTRAVALLLAMFAALQLQVSIAAVYKVGDSTGWTTIGNFDYQQWAANKSFKVGDIILFEYHPQFHNVMQVTHPEYQSCNATATPIATHTTGNDSIPITTRGHHYFICGVPGHCQSGQKVDINVPRLSSMAPTPAVSPSPSTPTAAAPSPSAAAPLYASVGLLGLAMAVLAAFA